ncbi:MAG: 50S ribosomal subunit protein L21 [Candidatus Westeberhardia cardiocondylae]|nr:50S ribosomal subunit protein L21 [Candidatus Westeberhardia cardiocondylae]
MYAIFQYGAKQYKVSNKQIIRFEKIDLEINKILVFDKILMVVDKHKVKVGYPFIKDVKIFANVLKHGRFDKILIIKYNRRKHHKKSLGHRQWYTDVKINNIVV